MSEITYLAKARALNRDMLNDFYPSLLSSVHIGQRHIKFLMMVHPIRQEIRYEIWKEDSLSLDTPFFDSAMEEYNRLFAEL